MTDDERLNQIYQAIYGVAGTEEKGMVGDLKDIKLTINHLGDDQARLNGKVNNLIWYLVGAGVLTASAGAGILKVALG